MTLRWTGLPLALVALVAVGCADGTQYIRAGLGGRPVRSLGLFRGNVMGTVNLDDGFLGIQAYEWLDDSTDATLSVNVPAWRRLGSWKLGDVKRGGWAMYAIHDIKRDRTAAYGTDRQHQGLVTITRFDLTTRIVEGTFEFEGEDRNEDGTFRVRNGAFRLRYQAVRPNSRAGSGD